MGGMAIATDAAAMGGAGGQSPVLRVIVENLFYPVTLDVLHQVQAVLLLYRYRKTQNPFWVWETYSIAVISVLKRHP